MNDYVTLKELATELGLDRSNMRKYAIKHGFSPVKVRSDQSGGQLTLAVMASEAETIRELRQSEGFSKTYTPVLINDGYFYAIQIVLDLAPNRVKLGYTNDVQARLCAHRTAAPTAILLKHWRCNRAWELAAIASITRHGCSLIANEVFECEDIKALIEHGDQFFAIMPNPCHS